MNLGVVDVFENQKRIESDARALRDKSAKFARAVTGEWVAIVDGFDAELRKIGDFERWIRAVEFDLDNITGVVERVARRRGNARRATTRGGEARDDVADDPSEGNAAVDCTRATASARALADPRVVIMIFSTT